MAQLLGVAWLSFRPVRPAKKQEFLYARALGASVKSAAEYANVDRSTPYLWRQTDPSFAAAWNQARSSLREQLVEVAVDLALAGDSGMLKFLINRLDTARATERPYPTVRRVTIIPPAPAQADGATTPTPPKEFITVKYAPPKPKEPAS